MVSPAWLKRYRSLTSQPLQSLALSTPSGFRDMASRNNYTPIVVFSSSLQCSRSCANVFGSEKTRNTPYRPQANRKCKKVNRTLISMLRRAVQKRPYDWEPLLSPLLQAYRSTIFKATGFTPYRLTFGREMRLPIDLGTPSPEPQRDI